jgi:twitching motility protein PilT
MDQNTAQDNNTGNVKFNYPDFSQSNQVAPQGVQPTQSNNDVKKIEELKQNLQSLIQSDAKQNQPTPQPKPSEKPKQVESQPPVEQPFPLPGLQKEETKASEPALQSKSETPQAYVQQPSPLLGLQKEVSTADISDIASTIEPPTQQSFDPLPTDLPKFRESLDNIMPDFKKPKAMERSPKSDNLAKPVQKNEPERENLIKREKIEGQDKELNTVKQEPVSNEVIGSSELNIEKLLSEAINRNASDLHIAVGYPPIIRVDGELIDLDEKVLNPEDAESLIFAVLSDEKKELLEVNREIDFAYTFKAASTARFRVNAYYSMKNLSAAFRLIPSRIRTIEELMLPQMYHQFAKLKQGLILVTGPTGHGKSTTLAAILEDINRTRFCHIVTIEDPIEYVFEGKKALIDQREMNDDTHSWNIALRSALRQDPDVILVGEMRDFETIASAITLAETGHLVFATLHTNSASQTLDRIIDVFPENQQQQVRTQVANTLQAVVAQRLIPLDKGGRRAVSEIMLNNSAVSNLIREGKMHQVDNVIRTSSDIGMIYLEKSLVSLVREGVISVQKAQEYAVHPEEVLRLLKS